MPSELDVPHWGRERVKEMRASVGLSEAVTDRMIWARLMEYNGATTRTRQGQLDALAKLEQEVKDDA